MELLYFFETVYDSDTYGKLALIKINGDRWCNQHCVDIHASYLEYDPDADKTCLTFKFRDQIDMTAFQIGFSPHDYV